MDTGTVEPPLMDTPFNEQLLYNKQLSSLLRTLILVSKCSLYYGGYNALYCYFTSIGLYLTAYLMTTITLMYPLSLQLLYLQFAY